MLVSPKELASGTVIIFKQLDNGDIFHPLVKRP